MEIVKRLEATFGGINLEDISAPRCFHIERRLREEMSIPVFHDDQHGTAIVVAAALINAVKVAGRSLPEDFGCHQRGRGGGHRRRQASVGHGNYRRIILSDTRGAISGTVRRG